MRCVLCLLLLTVVASAQSAKWTEYKDPSGKFTILLPSKPTTVVPGPPNHIATAPCGDSVCNVAWGPLATQGKVSAELNLGQQKEFLDRMGKCSMGTSHLLPTIAPGYLGYAHHASCTTREKVAVTYDSNFYVGNGVFFIVAVTRMASAPPMKDMQRLFKSFRILDPSAPAALTGTPQSQSVDTASAKAIADAYTWTEHRHAAANFSVKFPAPKNEIVVNFTTPSYMVSTDCRESLCIVDSGKVELTSPQAQYAALLNTGHSGCEIEERPPKILIPMHLTHSLHAVCHAGTEDEVSWDENIYVGRRRWYWVSVSTAHGKQPFEFTQKFLDSFHLLDPQM